MALTVRPADDCRWDALALGEVMLRLDPGEVRVRNARAFTVWEGGGEYNVARGLAKTFRLRTAIATALPDNEVGRLTEDLILQGGVDASPILWRAFDGVGRNTRVGLNFTERGFGARAPLGVYDRGASAASQIAPGAFDWDALFGQGVRWFHTGGVFAALSQQTARAALEAAKAARRHGALVSYDLNYRASLWKAQGDLGEAQALNRAIAAEADVLIGDDHGFAACLGFEAQGLLEGASPLDPRNFETLSRQASATFPNLKLAAATLRQTRTASRHDWSAAVFDGTRLYQAQVRELDIFDRVGGGDAFVAGLAYALLAGKPAHEAVEFGAAHGALAMTTPGDNAMTSLAEVEALIRGESARIIR